MVSDTDKPGRSPDVKLVSEIVTVIAQDRQLELQSLIAQSDFKIK